MEMRGKRNGQKYGKNGLRISILISVFFLLLTAGCSRTGESDSANEDAGEMGAGADSVFSGHRPEKEAENDIIPTGELRLANLAFGMEYAEMLATQFCLENRECSIIVEEPEDDSERETFREKIFMELAAGKGPDLMWVSKEDMRVLNDKGLLMDLDPIIGEETKSRIFPGVLQAGTLDGRLVAIMTELKFNTMIVSDNIWEKDSWTRTDFLDALDKNRSRVEWPVVFYSNRLSYLDLLDMVLLTDYSDFIDWERGTCGFDSKEFRRILRVCREYGKPDNVMRDEYERMEMLKDGRSLAAIDMYTAGLWQFSQSMNQYGGDCHVVGFPTASGRSGHFLFSNGYLAVNANAVNTDAIRCFLAYLWDYDNQFSSWLSVRRDVAWDKVIVKEDTGEFGENLGSAGSPVFNPLETKPDGSTYQREFIELLESCVPEPERPEAVRKILREELSFYFEGAKSIDEVARVIQNRVQLYLDERK